MLAAVQMNSENRPFASQLVEYLLLAMPDAKLQQRLLQLRDEADTGREAAGNAANGIPIASFTAGEVMEPTIIKWIQRIVSNQQCCEVRLSGYYGRPPEAIYLRVLDPLPFQQIAGSLGPVDELIQSSGYPPAKRNLRPQLCIAPALAAENVAPFSAEQLQTPFLATFMLEELLLLRRHFALDEFKVAQLFRLRP